MLVRIQLGDPISLLLRLKVGQVVLIHLIGVRIPEEHPFINNVKDYTMTDNVSAEQLRQFIERVERLEEEKKGISDDIKDVYGEAKATGFDAKIMKQIVRLRKKTRDARMEEEALLETYKEALGID